MFCSKHPVLVDSVNLPEGVLGYGLTGYNHSKPGAEAIDQFITEIVELRKIQAAEEIAMWSAMDNVEFLEELVVILEPRNVVDPPLCGCHFAKCMVNGLHNSVGEMTRRMPWAFPLHSFGTSCVVKTRKPFRFVLCILDGVCLSSHMIWVKDC